ncbi:MAG: LacI family DNA-binding transcriptional regulator [Devosia sp.]|uniref:LacI family DNA-binding transcriptional regulator n=1 Tax=Devosia sp. TaxID=1871048 RepID=UPI0024CA3275|nr:LacI family DNA-binding transcriptional regulator [Devosia sp.]UYN98959.1 MAG: LacI family DNA-binding transcriptional regulator [Devosia sp.]
MPLTTQREIARRAKTSLKTVSRVINRDPLVNAQTRARIEAIIAEIGYEPSQAARMMRSQRSNVIGFLADGVATTTSSIDLVRGAQDVAWERGKQMMLFNIERGTQSADMADSQLAAFRAEAIIYATIFHQEVDIATTGVPHVLLNCFDRRGRHAAVVPDDYQLAFELTRIIYERGYKRPVFLNLGKDIVASRLRGEGFVNAARAAGHDAAGQMHTAVISPAGAPTEFATRQILSAVMAGGHRPDLVLCGQDIMAMNVYFELAELGLKVGRDIAVASFDNFNPVAGLLQPGLSTMDLPYYDMGRAAMTLAIDGPEDGQVLRLKGTFIDRDSL